MGFLIRSNALRIKPSCAKHTQPNIVTNRSRLTPRLLESSTPPQRRHSSLVTRRALLLICSLYRLRFLAKKPHFLYHLLNQASNQAAPVT